MKEILDVVVRLAELDKETRETILALFAARNGHTNGHPREAAQPKEVAPPKDTEAVAAPISRHFGQDCIPIKDAAGLVGKDISTIRHAIKDGRLEAKKLKAKDVSSGGPARKPNVRADRVQEILG